MQLPAAAHAHRVGPENIHARSGFLELVDHRAQMRRIAMGHRQVAAGDGPGHQKCSRLNTVGIDAITRAMQTADAMHAHRRCAGAFDLRAHGNQQRGQIGNFGLTRAVLHQRFTLGQNGGHQ